MAFSESFNSRRGGNHARVFDCIAALRRRPHCILSESSAGRLHVEPPMRPCRGRRNYFSSTLWQFHTAAPLARHGLHRDRNGDRSVSLDASLAVGGSIAPSRTSILAPV